MNLFTAQKTTIQNLFALTRHPHKDNRGFLSRIFCSKELEPFGWDTPIAQINHTNTEKSGTIRGLHFQYAPHAEMKLITCIRGKIWDVAVDLRPDSPTFLQYHGVILSAKNHISFLIPQGFAHGFQTLTDNAELLYCHSKPYDKKAEGGLNPNDPSLSIKWPTAVTEISARDKAHTFLNDDFHGVQL